MTQAFTTRNYISYYSIICNFGNFSNDACQELMVFLDGKMNRGLQNKSLMRGAAPFMGSSSHTILNWMFLVCQKDKMSRIIKAWLNCCLFLPTTFSSCVPPVVLLMSSFYKKKNEEGAKKAIYRPRRDLIIHFSQQHREWCRQHCNDAQKNQDDEEDNGNTIVKRMGINKAQKWRKMWWRNDIK